MKKILATLVLSLAAMSSFAEASFDQIESLIQQKNYAAAASGLEGIIQNHPKSAKAFYAMAQAQAGLGNLEKANKALNIATGLNPTLDFAPEGSVNKLKDAITPQTAKIEYVEESHFWRNFWIGFILFASAGGAVFFFTETKRQAKEQAERDAAEEKARADREAERKRQHMEMLARQDAQRQAELAAEAALKAHKNYGKPGFDPANPDKLKTKAQLKAEADALAIQEAEREARMERLRAERAEEDARRSRMSYSTSTPTHTTVVNNSGNDMLTGVLIGNMMGSSHHHDHDTTIIRETVREVEVPAKAPRSSWDDTGSTPSISTGRSSSWDDTPKTSSRSSSWDDDSSSKSSSSSWSSSSSSDSSSSWSDSSSSSSSSSWD